MSRWENWRRRRIDPNSSPVAVAISSKLLGELMADIRRMGLFQGKRSVELPDGSIVTAQFDGTTPIVYVDTPSVVPPKPKTCHCVAGVVGVSVPFTPPGGVPPSKLAVLDDEIYMLFDRGSLYTVDFDLYRYDPKLNTFTPIGGTYSYTKPDASKEAANPAFAYRNNAGSKRLIVAGGSSGSANNFWEMEIGTGVVESYLGDDSALVAAGTAAQPIFSTNATDNSDDPTWKQTSVVPVLVYTSSNWVTTYDFVARKWAKPQPYAGAIDTPGAMGFFNNTVYLAGGISGDDSLQYDLDAIDMSGGRLAHSVGTMDMYPNPGAYAQACCCVLAAAGYSNPSTATVTNEIWLLNLANGTQRLVGHIPSSDVDSLNALVIAALDAFYVVSWEYSPNPTWHYSNFQITKVT